MQIPAAMFIEEAQDMLETELPIEQRLAQQKELHVAVGDLATEEFSKGYHLGLETARVILMQSPKAVAAGVSDIL